MINISSIYITLGIIIFILIMLITTFFIFYKKNKINQERIALIPLIGMLGLILILIFQTTSYHKLQNQLDTKISSLEGKINSLNAQINDQNSSIDDLLDSQQKVYYYEITYGDVYVEDKKVDVIINFSPKEYGVNSKVYIQAVNKDKDDDYVEVETTGYAAYEGKLKLSINSKYDIYVLEEFEDIIKTYKLAYINLPNLLQVDCKIEINLDAANKPILTVLSNVKNIPDAFKVYEIFLQIKDSEDNLIYNGDIIDKMDKSGITYSYNIGNNVNLDYKKSYTFKITVRNQFKDLCSYTKLINKFS